MKRLDTYITSYRKTGFAIKSDQKKKALFMKTRIRLMPIFLIAFLIVAGFGLFNIFFTLQVILKFVIAYSSALSLYYIVIIDYNTAMDWQSYSTRNESIKGKILHSIKEGVILFGISMIIIGIIYLIRLPQNLETSLLEKITGDETPLSYMPNTIETILLAGIILLTLISIIAYIRWFYLRGIKITGYFKDKERIKNVYCVATSLNYPSKLPEKTLRKMELIAQKVAEAIELKNWISHIEVITYKDEIKLIDFGARGGGAGYIPTMIVPHISGVYMMEEFIRMILGEKNNNIKIKQNNAVVYRFFTPNPGKIVEIQGIDELQHIVDLLDFHLNVKVGDCISNVNTQLDRAGYFVIKANSLDSALKDVKKVENIVKFITE